MKKSIVFFLALSALPLAAQTQAQTEKELETVTITESAEKITIPNRLYKMWPEEFYKFKGGYDLSNGQVLALFDRGRRMYAQIGDQPRHEIVATAQNAFVALDRQLKMRIDLHDNGEASGELYMVVPAQSQSKLSLPGEQLYRVALR